MGICRTFQPFEEGERVWYDENTGKIVYIHSDAANIHNPDCFEYTVDWGQGTFSRVWGCDLMSDQEKMDFEFDLATENLRQK